ncbi:prepilin-type N-terminal cleavage/methylation domain-containing protein [Salmonella enterica subsp. enterica serovar Infantis]|uniref:type 4 pilus major pilin n=1 Tax=Enterobacterales TaxID=91347 RepID=UPI0012CACAEE|nr:type 4 pilus major pilin [Enterobacter hormaechei]EBU5881663.1 prepilin-type N-terminal cleavage/methylation domain-containing protein [Salmonella enterica subsp. enterica serovar Oranienburg]ECT4192055.1 prepilin-type N-terminal cleavage/methylation domain-containing protein [Salmonella enterica]EDS9968578.1 prepilin-type N-terminal cleavage/methylation domain-containing protein [Salmonella enterica subsp. enterica serovar Kentucky]EFS6100428.1 prepilin-type N-terminal cleavage/methylation 
MRKGFKKGFSLIELLLVLAATGVVAATFYVYGKVQAHNRVNRATHDLASISKAMNAILTTRPTIAEANTMLTSSKALPSSLPSSMLDKTGSFVNAYGGKLTITPHNGSDDFYDVSYYNVPSDACIELVSASRAIYRTITIPSYGTKITAASGVSDIASFCSGFTSTSSVMVFTDAA